MRPGIYFASDPAFRGKKRELTAHDYVYSLKRIFDPKARSFFVYLFENKLVGLDGRDRHTGHVPENKMSELHGRGCPPSMRSMHRSARTLPDGAARTALFVRMNDMIFDYAPWILTLSLSERAGAALDQRL